MPASFAASFSDWLQWNNLVNSAIQKQRWGPHYNAGKKRPWRTTRCTLIMLRTEVAQYKLGRCIVFAYEIREDRKFVDLSGIHVLLDFNMSP